MRDEKAARRSAQNTTDTLMTNLMPFPDRNPEAAGTRETRQVEADCYRREAHNDSVSGKRPEKRRSYL